jgi:UDP-N-acetylmuramate dehydrogenase
MCGQRFERSPVDTNLARYTTLELGGPAHELIEVDSGTEFVDTVRKLDAQQIPLLILAGGSNVVIADEGFPGTVVLVRSQGIHVESHDSEHVAVKIAAGHNCDDLVSWSISEKLAGIECLSGIPGSVGATPIQNVGAYGQEVSNVIKEVHVYDRHTERELSFLPEQCGFSYRDSLFKHSQRYLIIEVVFLLQHSAVSLPLRYGELTRNLDLSSGGVAPLDRVREEVLRLRRSKGMVLDPADPDTRSVGSFFTNPVVDADTWREVQRRCDKNVPPHWPVGTTHTKISAAWLIEQAGFTRGYPQDGVAISSKHTLALTNFHAGTTTGLISLARKIRDEVHHQFGVYLFPEPVLVGVKL